MAILVANRRDKFKCVRYQLYGIVHLAVNLSDAIRWFASGGRKRAGITALIYAAIGPTTVAMTARIYQRPKNAMQSGRAGTDEWLLEFAPAEARRADPLMGWAGSGDVQSQVVLHFASQAEAQAYADQYGIAASVHATPPRRLKLQAYADNFR